VARTPWTNTPSESESQLWDSIAEGVAASLAVDALTRDRANQQADAELKLLKESGLASLLIPTEFGGPGGHWSTALRAVRILARADSSIAQLLAYSYITQSGIVFIGDPERWRHWFQASASGTWLWGDSVNPIDPALSLAPCESGYVLNGRKRYSTGAATGDVTVNAAVAGEGTRRGVLVNAADDPAHCDFILPSVLRRGALAIAVSTGGTSPALARVVREELERHVGEDYAALASVAGEVRGALRVEHRPASAAAWRAALADRDFRRLIARGRQAAARRRLRSRLVST